MKEYVYLAIFGSFLLVGCSSTSSQNTYKEEDDNTVAVENPYSPGTGHYAGYEWAERTGRSCSGNSNSFIEGCEEYYRQMSLAKN